MLTVPARAFEPWEAALVESARVARLATIAPDGRPHLVPVCFAWTEGRFAIAIDEKPKRSGPLARVRNIERDPRVTLLVDHYDDDWTHLAWLRIDGKAAVLSRGDARPDILAALRARYQQYASMDIESRPLILITPSRIASWRFTGQGP